MVKRKEKKSLKRRKGERMRNERRIKRQSEKKGRMDEEKT